MKELLFPIGANAVLGVILLALLVWKRRPDTVLLLNDADALAEFQRHFPEAGVFMIWDRLFGTFVPEQAEEPPGRRHDGRHATTASLRSAHLRESRERIVRYFTEKARGTSQKSYKDPGYPDRS